MTVSFAIIGLGEVGRILAADLAARGAGPIATFDISPERLSEATRFGAVPRRSLSDAIRGAQVVVSAVTAAASLGVAAESAPLLHEGQIFLDLNSVSPTTKREGAALVHAHAGRYVEAAVMAPVPPHRLRVPILLGGPHAERAHAVLAPWGLDTRVFSPEIGRASAVKMCRSIFVKGLEALAVESLLTAHHYGVEQEVLSSLSNVIPHPNWPEYARYLISRTLIHGRRRAEEAREVAKTVWEAGVAARLSPAIAEVQADAGETGSALAKVLRKLVIAL